MKQLSEKAVREKLREEELDDHETDITEASKASTASKKKKRGRASTITAGAFLVMGCELQLSQYVFLHYVTDIVLTFPVDEKFTR